MKITFDVSSVKPAQTQASRGSIRRLDIGIVSVSSMTVTDMIELFYHVRPFQIFGGPHWMNENRFDVIGKDSTILLGSQRPTGEIWAQALATEDDQMQKVLADRFGLQLHHETRLVPTLNLLANPKKPLSAVPCSTEYKLQQGVVKGAIRMASLAALLKSEYGMPVSDHTGLTACYYINTHWTIDPNDESLPSPETALHDLGLRLKKTRAEDDVLVLDRVTLPQPD